MDLIRFFDGINNTGVALAGYTSGLCGEWTHDRFEKFAAQLDINCADIIVANQSHTDDIYVARLKDAGYGVIKSHNDNYFDAVITRETGLMLCVHTADCVPVVLLDPVKKAAGIVHSGWVGSSKRIAEKTVRKMIEIYNSDPENIICSIGPYNRSCCYEVGDDVYDIFNKSFSDGECKKLFSNKNADGKYLLDLGAAVSFALCSEGVNPVNIYECGHCTYHTPTFSSWRRTRNKKHQILTFIMLLER